MDWMDRPEEIAKHEALCRAKGVEPLPGGTRPIIEAMSAGDVYVFEAMWTFWNMAHRIDDECDWMNSEQRELVASTIVFDLENMTGAFGSKFWWAWATNPFIQEHRDQIKALYISCINRWLDGDLMENPEQAAVVRCGDLDVLLHMVYLARGFAAMRECSLQFRRYDLPDEKARNHQAEVTA